MATRPASIELSIIIAKGKNNRSDVNNFISMKRTIQEPAATKLDCLILLEDLKENSALMKPKAERKKCLHSSRSFSLTDVLLVSADFNKILIRFNEKRNHWIKRPSQLQACQLIFQVH